MLVAGCSGGPTHGLDLQKVTGKVTLNGTPVEGAVITFSPKSEIERTAFATTDAEGHYELTTMSPGDGAVAGEYTVIVIKQDKASIAAPLEPSDPNYGKSTGYPGTKNNAKFITPQKYSSPGTSGLSATVEAGSNEIDFDLKS